jgi:hypothetical protein
VEEVLLLRYKVREFALVGFEMTLQHLMVEDSVGHLAAGQSAVQTVAQAADQVVDHSVG